MGVCVCKCASGVEGGGRRKTKKEEGRRRGTVEEIFNRLRRGEREREKEREKERERERIET